MQLNFDEILGDLLAQRGMSVADLAEAVPDKASLVPKWASGGRVPRPEDIEVLKAALKPSEEEERALELARKSSALREALEKHKLSLSKSDIEQQLRTLFWREQQPGNLLIPLQLQEELMEIRQIRLQGRPLEALGAMRFLARQIMKDINSLRNPTGYPLLVAFFKERLSLAVNICEPGTVWNTVQEDVNCLIDIGKEWKNQDVIAFAHFRAGDAHHLDLRPEQVIPYCEYAIRHTSDIELQARSYSIMLISLAKRASIENRRKYDQISIRAENILLRALDENSIGALWLLNEWGHSMARLGEANEAEILLLKAQQMFDEAECEGLRYKNLKVALRRAILVAASKGAFDIDAKDIIQMAIELKEEALEGHYSRIVHDADKVRQQVLGNSIH